MATSPPATVPLLHQFLGIGLAMVAAASLVLMYLGIVPMMDHDSAAPATAYALSAIALVLAAVAIFVFKPRVPARPSDQPVEQYWSTPHVGLKVMPVWFLLEGAGMVAAVGYYLTGEPVSAVATAVTLGAFWLCGPNALAKT
jgi:hypothetical protein